MRVGALTHQRILPCQLCRGTPQSHTGNAIMHCSPAWQGLIRMLVEEGQQHLFAGWGAQGEQKREVQLLHQLHSLNSQRPGGLREYVRSAKQLLQDSRLGKNPYDGYQPEIPKGVSLQFGSSEFRQYEDAGMQAAGRTAFVLVAGGLGERLGYSGIKLALPAESARGACFLQVYVENILAIQAKTEHNVEVPLAIMTSDDTHAGTEQLLRDNKYFGANPLQIHLLKQEKVACFSDNDAHLALCPDDPYRLLTKPHGHGDVHALLHASGLVDIWHNKGFEHIFFFQDTNAQCFKAFFAALGVSVQKGFALNWMAVPRKAKEAIGACMLLRDAAGRASAVNVEYNQLDPLLRATINPAGDVNDATGWSPFPGNINHFIVEMTTYVDEMRQTKGRISEFVNPKYADSDRSTFKSPTRLECMMQDFSKSLESTAGVGYTAIEEVWAANSPVKNSPADALVKVAQGCPPHSATTGELDVYKCNCRTLQMLGADIALPTPAMFNGLAVEVWPCVVWAPSFAQTINELAAKLNGPRLKIGKDSVLIIEAAEAQIQSLQLNGALVILESVSPSPDSASINAVVNNDGWHWRPLQRLEPAKDEEKIRGFKVMRRDTAFLSLPKQLVLPLLQEHLGPATPAKFECRCDAGVGSWRLEM